MSMRSIRFDLIRSRIPDAMVIDDSIHLASAANYITGVKSLLATTATTELRPLPYFSRVRKDAAEYADTCRFGHTFRGSFGFTIESPVTSYSGEVDLFDNPPAPPFERRVVERLARGIGVIQSAVKRDNVDLIVDGVSAGFGSNGCDQLADLVQRTAHTGMIFSFTFSADWPIAAEFKDSQEFWVGPEHVEISRVAAERMRDKLSFIARVTGRVVGLQNETDPSDVFNTTGDHEVLIDWANEDYGDMRIRVKLTPADYLAAVEAHAKGRRVAVLGTVQRRGRRWVLYEARDFTVLHAPGLPLQP